MDSSKNCIRRQRCETTNDSWLQIEIVINNKVTWSNIDIGLLFTFIELCVDKCQLMINVVDKDKKQCLAVFTQNPFYI
ncbi:hypothetical protein Ahia01_000224400 [Argonauta hians]